MEDVLLQIGEFYSCKIYPARFADDVTLLFDDVSVYPKILEGIDHFLLPRGMKLNRDKCFLRRITLGEPFNFVGFAHHVVKKRRPVVMFRRTKRKKFTLISLPLKPKIVALKNKINKILKDFKRL